MLTSRFRAGVWGVVALLCLNAAAPAMSQNLEGINDPGQPFPTLIEEEQAPAAPLPGVEPAPAEAPPPSLLPPPIVATEPVPVSSEVAPVQAEGIVAPSPDQLSSPGETPPPVVTNSESVEIQAITVAPRDDTDQDLFFDADTLVPTGEMGANSPRKVDPATQPASKLIIVRKNATADSQVAQIVAAQRAMKLGRYDAALDMYNRLYEKNKRDPRILMGRAVSLHQLGQFDAAMQSYEQLLEVDPNNAEAKINMLGLLGSKYPAVALRRLTDMREANPNNVGVVAQLAVMQAEIGNFEDAMRYLAIAASMEPNNANHIYNMAVIADRSGSKSDAIKYYEQALEIDTVYGRGQSIPREAVYERLARIR
jgi:Flp pilus assembly protein TadD